MELLPTRLGHSIFADSCFLTLLWPICFISLFDPIDSNFLPSIIDFIKYSPNTNTKTPCTFGILKFS